MEGLIIGIVHKIYVMLVIILFNFCWIYTAEQRFRILVFLCPKILSSHFKRKDTIVNVDKAYEQENKITITVLSQLK